MSVGMEDTSVCKFALVVLARKARYVCLQTCHADLPEPSSAELARHNESGARRGGTHPSSSDLEAHAPTSLFMNIRVAAIRCPVSADKMWRKSDSGEQVPQQQQHKNQPVGVSKLCVCMHMKHMLMRISM